MPLSCRARRAALVAALLVPTLSQAGRPLVTDDATIVDPGLCQLEAWTVQRPGLDEYWAVPHCAAGRNWELAAGVGRLRSPTTGSAAGSGWLEAKTIFRRLSTNSWGVGLLLVNHFGGGRGPAGELWVVVPFTASLLDDRLLVHANAGWLRPRGERSGAIWAVAAEWNATRRTGLTLESYGSQHGHTYLQAGGRYDLLPNRLTLDAAVGQRATARGEEHYLALGLTFTFAMP